MKLSMDDLRLIQRLRKIEESWLWLRWIALLIGVGMSATAIFLFQRIWEAVAPDQILIIICIFGAPISGILLFVSLAAALYAILCWKGRPTERLLVKLAKELDLAQSEAVADNI